ncbi:MAG TPA: stress response translation initiation inhibitor YciH [Spirochaetota bacterium]|nr:stress response translation initiation inhibitor YciH [Spirochaetota bacterium]
MTDKIVYSTESGDLREKEKDRDRVHHVFRKSPAFKKDGVVRVQKESKGRSGKIVSAIYGLPLSDIAMMDMAARLKQKCGAGGTVKDGVILIQGDKVDMIVQLLQKEGFTVKRAGA